MNLNALRLAIHKAKLSNIQLQQLIAYRTLFSTGTGEKKEAGFCIVGFIGCSIGCQPGCSGDICTQGCTTGGCTSGGSMR